MYSLNFTNQFKKDYAKCKARNWDLKLIEEAFEILTETGDLPKDIYKTHPLSNNWKGHNDSHIKPNWLLIWTPANEDNEINLVRTGTHPDIFG